ncbi:hypothetical protein EC988_001611 [Linderina pennispora]|nr:hypothetical protein EC988_001611 [Linderina pennispora]
MLPRTTFAVSYARPWICAAAASKRQPPRGKGRCYLQAIRAYSDDKAKESDKHADSADSTPAPDAKAGAPNLDSLFDMLDLPDTPQAPPRASRKAEPTTDDFDLDDIFKLIDANSAATDRLVTNQSRSPAKAPQSPKHGEDRYDPMAEFERILSDLASDDTEVYKRSRPAPGFWDESSGQLSRAQDSKINETLDPEGLFKEGPLASLFSARKLTSNPSAISPLAKRIQKADRIAKEQGLLQTSGKIGQATTTAAALAPVDANKEDQDEQILLARLAQCQTVSALAAFVTSALGRQGPAATADATAASPELHTRPSAAVVAEAIRLAREMQAPPMAYYIYNLCRTQLDLIDKLRVLDSRVYEEMLLTAWATRRDISAVMFVMQDLVGMGVTGQGGLRRQISTVVKDLHDIYLMPEEASRIEALKHKIYFEDAGSTGHVGSQPAPGLPSRFNI